MLHRIITFIIVGGFTLSGIMMLSPVISLEIHIQMVKFDYINHFHTNVSFLYSVKTSETLWFSDVFRGYRNRIGVKRVNPFLY